jgi:hypothetical protein
MQSSNRVLIGFGIGLAVLVILTVVLVLSLGQKSAPALPQNTPEGTVQAYLVAVQEKDYTRAYSYLMPFPTPTDNLKPYPPYSYENWLNSARNTGNVAWKATLGRTSITGNKATVEVNIEVFRPAGPFDNPVHTNNITFALTQEGDRWLITTPTDLFWIY